MIIASNANDPIQFSNKKKMDAGQKHLKSDFSNDNEIKSNQMKQSDVIYLVACCVSIYQKKKKISF